ncbi:MAG: anaerobic dehydrogenase, typically selenocysteine-containing, partial [Phycisphaerales bacterium]|nr:anaerobic dehydrogenase, typically selenocysteine-containing [Phycisphaerales bacterium]
AAAPPAASPAAPNPAIPVPAAGPGFDLTRMSSALAPDKVVDSACQFCNSNCRVKVHVKAGRAIDVRGEPADPVQAGNLCVKAKLMAELRYSPHRLTRPLVRTGGAKGSPDSRFEPVSWDEALGRIATKLVALRDAGEARAVANKTSGRLPRGTGSLVGRFFTLLGSPNDTDVGPVCNDAGGNALAATVGLGNFTNGYGVDPITGREDLGSANFFLFLGTNQAETHPVTFAHLLRERVKTGARLVVVDPRLTPTGAAADEWVATKPGTDLALVLAMLHEVITSDLYDRTYVAKWVAGFDELKRHLTEKGYTPEWAAGVTGVPAETIRRVARGYATAKPASLFCNAGVSHQIGAFDTYRALAFLAAVTGNIGVPGGGCNFMHNTWPGGLNLPPITPAAAGRLPRKDVALPVGPDWFAEAILNNRPYPLKAVLTCGNPLVGSANTAKVKAAFAKLEFYAYTGLFMDEAAYYADVILPVATGLEFEGVYMRRDDRAIRWQHAAVPRAGDSRTDTEIWVDLAHAMAKADKTNGPAYWADHFPLAWRDYRTLWAEFVKRTPGASGMTAERMEKRAEPLRWPCPTPDHPGTSTLYLDHPSWYAAAEALDPKHKGKRFLTPSGKIEVYTPELDAKLAAAGHAALPVFYAHPETPGGLPTIAYDRTLVPNPVNGGALTPMVTLATKPTPAEVAVRAAFPLVGTTGRPGVVHFAGVTHWTPTGKLMTGVRLVQLHPEAAAAAGVADGDSVVVESPRGAVTGTAQVWPGIRPDTVFVPQGFGPMQKVGPETGARLYDAANALSDDRYFDNLSGQQAYKCFACRVRKA